MKLKNINVNGIAHIALNVNSLEKSKDFYDQLLPFLGMSLVHESEKSFYYIGARTGILLQKIDNKHNAKFSQNVIGLHHFCFRARSETDVNLVYEKLLKIKANIIRGPIYGNWVKGYFYILFEDPDNIRIEVNYVPDQGVFKDGTKFNPSGDY